MILTTSSCATNRPHFKPKIYVGDFEKKAFVRAQAGEIIKCDDPGISGYRAMSAYDLRLMYELFVLSCDSFSEPVVDLPTKDKIDLFEQFQRGE